ncbi:MAG: Uma2 family endonuclease [Gammaproteobacteria bacterium]|nr:Uma2 family endonuclease [Gammaproteobacteria bacterium]
MKWVEPACLPVLVNLPMAKQFSDDEFLEFCQLNRDLRIERTAEGRLSIIPPTGFDTGRRNVEMTRQLANWAIDDGRGVAGESSTGFRLPNGAVRAPDVSWIRADRLAAVLPDAAEGFLPLCPDFVLELRSPTDRLATVQAKMVEYMENGAQLGWLIDPSDRTVHIYRPGKPVERLRAPASVSGEDVLPGFELLLGEVW